MALAPQVLAGVGPGEEVITSTVSFSAVPNSIIYTGAQPTFIDSGRKDWNFDAALFKAELERRAAAGVCEAGWRRPSSTSSPTAIRNK